MAFCIRCGRELVEGAAFCAFCGTAVQQQTEVYEKSVAVQPQVVYSNPVVQQPVVVSSVETDTASVMLRSLGTCSRYAAANLLSDVCGYTDDEALLIVSNTPITVAQHLDDRQADYLAQAMAEYGMEVCVYDRYGYRSAPTVQKSIFDAAGQFLRDVASVLGLIGVKHRIDRSRMCRWSEPHPHMRPVVYHAPVQAHRPAPMRHAIHRQPVAHQPVKAAPSRQPVMQNSHHPAPHTTYAQPGHPTNHLDMKKPSPGSRHR